MAGIATAIVFALHLSEGKFITLFHVGLLVGIVPFFEWLVAPLLLVFVFGVPSMGTDNIDGFFQAFRVLVMTQAVLAS